MWLSSGSSSWLPPTHAETSGGARHEADATHHPVDSYHSFTASTSTQRRIIPCSPAQHAALSPLHRAAPAPPQASRGSGANTRLQVRHNVELQDTMRCNAKLTTSDGKGSSAPLVPSVSSSQASAATASNRAKAKTCHRTRKNSTATCTSALSTAPVLLRHTFHGTTRVLYADGHVETLTKTGETASPAASGSAAAAASSLPTLSQRGSASDASSKQKKKAPNAFAAAGASAADFGATSITSSSAATVAGQTSQHKARYTAGRGGLSLPIIVGAPPRAGGPSPPLRLHAFEAAAGTYGHHPTPRHSGATLETSRTTHSTLPTAIASTSHFCQPTRPSSQPQLQDAHVCDRATDSYTDSAAATEKPSSLTISVTNSRMATAAATGGASASTSAGQNIGPAPRDGFPLRGVDRLASISSPHSPNHANDAAGFFLTALPVEVLPLEDASASAPVPWLQVTSFLCEVQREIRIELAKEQRMRTEFYVSRFERSVHNSPSIFSLAFPFRPLREVYEEAAQTATNTATSCAPADGLCSGRRSPSTPPPTSGTAGTIPDILLPTARITTPTGWTLSQLIEQRLLPRETPALQHRFSELLTLRGILDAPDTMTCRFGVAFMWFVLLRCRKAHREQALVDGHRRLSKAFADVFPLSARDTVPTLDVLGQLLVEVLTCVRYEGKKREKREAEETKGKRQQQQRHGRSSTSPTRTRPNSPGGGDIGHAAQDVRSSQQQQQQQQQQPPLRDIPYYADLNEILTCKSFFPLLTGEWSYLLRHVHTVVAASSSAAASLIHLQPQHSTTLDPSRQEQSLQMSVVPSAKSLQPLCAIFHELWVLHGKYVEACLYEEALYKQLAVLFRNVCVQVARAKAGLTAAAELATDSITTPRDQKPNSTGFHGKGKEDEEDEVTPQLSSHIAVNTTQLTFFGTAATSSSAAQDSTLDGLLMAIAHATYFSFVFSFPNDVYAGVFDEEFRTDVVQWLSYCCHGVVTTHVQTRHWPVPVQTDYEAAQARQSTAEKRELAALGLHREEGAGRAGSLTLAGFTSEDATQMDEVTAASAAAAAASHGPASGRRTRANRGTATATIMGPSTATTETRKAALLTANSSGVVPQHTSSAREGLNEDPFDLENIVANAEFRLAHQFDRYSRAAAQHVSELERRMARLQRRHRLVADRNGCGGLQRPQSSSHQSRRGSCAMLSRASPSRTLAYDDEDAMGMSTHSLTSLSSQYTSFRRIAPSSGTPTTIAKTALPARLQLTKTKSMKSARRSRQKDVTPSFQLLEESPTTLPPHSSDGDASVFPSPVAATAPTISAFKTSSSMPKRGNRQAGSSKNNRAENGVGAARSGNDEQKSPLLLPVWSEVPQTRRRQSAVSHTNSGSSPRHTHGSAVSGVGNNKNSKTGQRTDARDLYRTSAFAKNDKSLVALASELNSNAVSSSTNNIASADILSKGLSTKEGADRSPNDGVDPDSQRKHHSALLAQSASTVAAASLLSSYPLCTCPPAITEYWLAMLLRVSSWWVLPTTEAVHNADFTLCVSPTTAAAWEEEEEEAHLKGRERTTQYDSAAQPQRQPFAVAHEPWRGVFGRIVAVPPISGAAQRAARLIDTLAESLPHQQSLVYAELDAQRRRQEQHRFLNAAVSLAQGSATDSAISPPRWNEFEEVSNPPAAQGIPALPLSSSSTSPALPRGMHASGVLAALAESDLGTATVPFISPFVGGLMRDSAGSRTVTGQPVASYLRRRGVGEIYQGCTSPFFLLYAATSIALGLSREEVALLQELLNTARDRRREKLTGGTFRTVNRSSKPSTAAASAASCTGSATTHRPNNTNSNHRSLALTLQSLRVPVQHRDVDGQQLLSSLLPLLPPSLTYASLRMETAAAADKANASAATTIAPEATTNRRGATLGDMGHTGLRTAHGTHKQPRSGPAHTTSAFAITAIPREEAKLRPRRMRPLQEEALRRRTQLLSDMDIIEKRDGVARQNYLVQQLRLANAIAQLNTDKMLRQYRARGRLALERLEVEDQVGVAEREGIERVED